MEGLPLRRRARGGPAVLRTPTTPGISPGTQTPRSRHSVPCWGCSAQNPSAPDLPAASPGCQQASLLPLHDGCLSELQPRMSVLVSQDGSQPRVPRESLSPARTKVSGAAWASQWDRSLAASLGASTRLGLSGAQRARPGVCHRLGSVGAGSGQQIPRHPSVAAKGSSSAVLPSPTCSSPPRSWGKAGGNQTRKKVSFGLMDALGGAREALVGQRHRQLLSAACAGQEEEPTGCRPAHAAAAGPSQRAKHRAPVASGGSPEISSLLPAVGRGLCPSWSQCKSRRGCGRWAAQGVCPSLLTPDRSLACGPRCRR